MIESIPSNMTSQQVASRSANPPAGTRPFFERDACWFLGRKDEAALLADLIQVRREVVLVGPPGRGKTSLVRAGVVPRLKQQGCRVLPIVRVGGPLPYFHLVMETGRNLSVFGYHTAVSWSGPGTDPRQLVTTKLPDLLSELAKQPEFKRGNRPTPLVAVFDQFDDFFTLHPKRDSHRERFFTQLCEALAADPLLRVLFVLRDQFLPQFLKYAEVLPERAQAQFRLERLSGHVAQNILKEWFGGWEVESGALARLTAFLAGNPDAGVKVDETTQQTSITAPRVEPMLLQLVYIKICAEPESKERRLTIDAVDQIVKRQKDWTIENYLEEFYEAELQHYSRANKEPAALIREKVASALVTRPIDYGYPWLPGPAASNDLQQTPEAETTAQLLHDLSTINPPLLVTEHVLGAPQDDKKSPQDDKKSFVYWYELANQNLGPVIQSANLKWKKMQEPAQRLLEQLQLWQRSERFSAGDRSALLDEPALAVAENWRESPEVRESGLLTDAIKQLIDRSRMRWDGERIARLQRQKQWWIGAFIILATFLVAVVILALTLREAQQNEHEARQQEHEARQEAQRRLANLTASDGVQLLESGDVPGSLLRFAQALHIQSQNELPRALEHARFGAALRQLSKPARLFRHNNLTYAEASRNRVYILTLGEGKVRIWNAETGQPVSLPVTSDENNPINAAIFSPDSLRVVTARGKVGGRTGKVEVWDIATKQMTELSHKGAVRCVTFSRDGALLVTGGEAENGSKGEVHIWDSKTLKRQRIVPQEGSVTYAAFSYDGERLVTGTQELKNGSSVVQVWSIKPKQLTLPLSLPCTATPGGLPLFQGIFLAAATLSDEWLQRPLVTGSHRHDVSYAAFCPPSGHLMVSVSRDAGEAKVWNVETGQQVMAPVHKDDVLYADFSPDGRYLVTTSKDCTAKVWDVSDNLTVSHFPRLTLEHNSTVFYASFSPGVRFLITSGRDQIARVWELATGKPLVPPLSHNGTVSSARFSSDGRQVLTAGPDTAQIWEVATSNPILPIVRLNDMLNYAALSHDSNRIVTATGKRASGAGACRVWDVSTGKSLKRMMHDGSVTYASFNSDGSRLVTVSERDKDGASTIKIWDLRSGTRVREAPEDWPVKGPVTCAAFSQDGTRIVLANIWADKSDDPLRNKGQVWIWDIATDHFKKIPSEPGKQAHDEPLTSVAFNPDGTRLVTTSTDDTARIWDVDTGELRATLNHTADVSYAVFSRGNELVLTIGTDGKAKIWKADTKLTNQEKAQPVAVFGHSASLNHGAFSSDGQRVVTAGQDGTVRVWHVESKELLAVFRHRGNVPYVAFRPVDGQVLALSYGAPTQLPGHEASVSNDTASNQIHARLWSLAPFERSSDRELQIYAEVISARRYDPDIGNLVSLEADDLGQRWGKLRNDPREFPFGQAIFDRTDPKEMAWHLRRADEARAAQEWFAEAQHISRLINGGSNKAELFARRARAYAKLPTWRRAAIDDYSRALTFNQLDSRLWSERADVFYDLRQWNQAASDYSEALKLQTDDAVLWESRAWTYSELRQWKNALRDASRAVKLAPEKFGPWRIRAWIKAELDDKDGARSDYEKAIEIRMDRAQIWYELALLHLAKGDLPAYRDLCRRMRASFAFATDASTANTVAWTCALHPVSTTDWAPLVQLAQKAAVDASDPEVRYLYLNTLGAVHYRTGNTLDAIKRFKEAMQIYMNQDAFLPEPIGTPPTRKQIRVPAEGTAWDWVFLAMAYHRLGDTAQAREWLDKALKPSVEDAKESWVYRLEIEILRKQAKALIHGR